MLRFSGLYQENCSDLYVTCQVFAEGKPLALPVRTSYKLLVPAGRRATPVGGTTVTLFGKYGMFRQGMHDLKVWPGVEGDGAETTSTPGRTSSTLGEDQMGRLAKGPDLELLSDLTKAHRQGHMVKVDWLDRLTFREIEMINESEKRSSNFMYLMVEFPRVKTGDKEYSIVYYEKDGDEASTLLTSSDIVKVPDPQMCMIIVSYPPTKQLTSEEQDLVWKFRYYLTTQEKALTKFLKCVNWALPQEAKQALELLGKWKPMDVEDSLELLSSQFTNPTVRRYAVARLQQADDEDLLMYLLQLVQALKYENFNDIQGGLDPGSKRDSQGLSESTTLGDLDSSQITSAVIATTGAPKSKDGADGENLEQDLCTFLISRACKNSTLANYLYWYVIVECEDQDTQQRDPKTHDMYLNVMRRFSQALLKKVSLCEIDPIPLPLEPQVRIRGIVPETATLFKSALMPAKLIFKTEDNELYPVIFKHGDDLRQDQLILQIISLMDKLLRKENLDLKLMPYKVLATSTKHGFMQFVQSVPVAEVLATEGNIQSFFRKHAPSEKGPYGISAEVMDTYVKSCAGYCVITYILGVGDRHLDNLLLTKTGNLLYFTSFSSFSASYSNLILNLFSLMVDANIPDIALEPDKTVKKVQDKFRLDLSDEEAVHYMQSLIDESVGALFAAVVEQIHKFAQPDKLVEIKFVEDLRQIATIRGDPDTVRDILPL
ncbi:Phosphatidylinositol 3-kinase catalytic subunit type 3 [Bagarius yarrelli]|uniref:Phosphatidylinositol 3-kinase catalytic subunit type 3 n=1 Tax=Bagarius yarrelli TaxID=175774 RepID=A0A556U653_BAGYA|nr:Phosphatidylinositol 3-kinase catalytic subunit type 3 [Bagarius yarrelli]